MAIKGVGGVIKNVGEKTKRWKNMIQSIGNSSVIFPDPLQKMISFGNDWLNIIFGKLVQEQELSNNAPENITDSPENKRMNHQTNQPRVFTQSTNDHVKLPGFGTYYLKS